MSLIVSCLNVGNNNRKVEENKTRLCRKQSHSNTQTFTLFAKTFKTNKTKPNRIHTTNKTVTRNCHIALNNTKEKEIERTQSMEE